MGTGEGCRGIEADEGGFLCVIFILFSLRLWNGVWYMRCSDVVLFER